MSMYEATSSTSVFVAILYFYRVTTWSKFRIETCVQPSKLSTRLER